MSRADLRNAIVLDVKLKGADLSYVDLRGSIVIGDMEGTNFYMARLERARLSGKLQNANLKRAKLRKASLAGADLRGADLAKARFHRTVLNQAKLQGVDFADVDLDTVYISGATVTVSQLPDFLKALAINVLESG